MTALAPADSTHPVIGRNILLPGQTFTARNSITGKRATFTYCGHLAVTASGQQWVSALDRRGNLRSVAVDAITAVRRMRRAG